MFVVMKNTILSHKWNSAGWVVRDWVTWDSIWISLGQFWATHQKSFFLLYIANCLLSHPQNMSFLLDHSILSSSEYGEKFPKLQSVPKDFSLWRVWRKLELSSSKISFVLKIYIDIAITKSQKLQKHKIMCPKAARNVWGRISDPHLSLMNPGNSLQLYAYQWSHQVPLGISNPVYTLMAFVVLSESQNKTKHHDPRKGLEDIGGYVEKRREGVEKE